MSSSTADREAIIAAYDALDAAAERVVGLDCEALTTKEWLALLARCEKVHRRIPAAEHPMINCLGRQATAEELGGKLSHAIAEATLITRAEASRRIKEAADLGPRHALTGEPLEPVLAATAAAQREGALGTGQVAVIRKFRRSRRTASSLPLSTAAMTLGSASWSYGASCPMNGRSGTAWTATQIRCSISCGLETGTGPGVSFPSPQKPAHSGFQR
jgi:hypothetical protein